MTIIEHYDEDICRLRNFRDALSQYRSGLYRWEIDPITSVLVRELIKREVERLTAERNNLIRLGN